MISRPAYRGSLRPPPPWGKRAQNRTPAKRASAAWPLTGLVLLLGCAAALIVAIALPRIPVQHRVHDFVVVVDVTQSMNVRDYTIEGQPVSRLDFVRQALRAALPRLPCGSKLGLGIFTEYRTFLLFAPVEVCANRDDLRDAIDHLNGQMAWAGDSEIAKGLYSGLLMAKRLEGSPALAFFTDGQEAPPINPLHRAEFPGKPGDVAGVIVGVGGPNARPIPKHDPDGRFIGYWQPNEVLQTDLYSLGRQGSAAGEAMVDTAAAGPIPPQLHSTPGNEHLSFLHEAYLELLASETRLAYGRLATADSLVPLLTTPALARQAEVPTDLRWIAALAGLLALAGSYRLRRPRAAATRG